MSATENATNPAVEETKEEAPLPSEYYAMVIDSGPIIKQDVRNLMGKAQTYVTTPSVMREIRDSKARDHLEHYVLPLLDLQIREPSDRAMQEIIAFAKQTGDYASLSTVDLQVLALTLDLEKEGNIVTGNTNLDHIRKTPKRMIGLGSILPMNGKGLAKPKTSTPEEEEKGEDEECKTNNAPSEELPPLFGPGDYDVIEDSDDEEEKNENETNIEGNNITAPTSTDSKEPPAKKSWATLVNPSAASTSLPEPSVAFSELSLNATRQTASNNDDAGGIFDDASEDGEEQPQNVATTTEEELQLEFPSLLAASTVPYEGEDDEINARGESETFIEEAKESTDQTTDQNPHHKTKASVFMTEEEKQQNLKPISKSGRTYNSFRKYKNLMKPKQPKKKPEPVEEDEEAPTLIVDETVTEFDQQPQAASRFLGGAGGGETMLEEDDDGEGWITSTDDIKFMKNEGGGRLDPGKKGPNNNAESNATKKNAGPHMSQRTACATTDFAMQNVLLQMNLILLSTEGMRIRRLKSWVMRCGACFHIHGANEDFQDETNHHMRRLFCSHCGSDMMQRISASVDGKTGRLKLHFSRRRQGRHMSTRGTKFSLPKPGSGNKYKGDLLLREDQLLSGAWNQKVKINSGRKFQTSQTQSIFGRDIAASVGCNVKSKSSATFGGKGWATSANTSSSMGGSFGSEDIRVGFGARRNPNAAKGRERRGKKKKSSDRACGMRRY